MNEMVETIVMKSGTCMTASLPSPGVNVQPSVAICSELQSRLASCMIRSRGPRGMPRSTSCSSVTWGSSRRPMRSLRNLEMYCWHGGRCRLTINRSYLMLLKLSMRNKLSRGSYLFRNNRIYATVASAAVLSRMRFRAVTTYLIA